MRSATEIDKNNTIHTLLSFPSVVCLLLHLFSFFAGSALSNPEYILLFLSLHVSSYFSRSSLHEFHLLFLLLYTPSTSTFALLYLCYLFCSPFRTKALLHFP